MDSPIYYVGLRDSGRGYGVLELADSVDQLSCEALRVYGPRERNIADWRDMVRRDDVLAFVNHQTGHNWTRVVVHRISSDDFTAGHVSRFGEALPYV